MADGEQIDLSEKCQGTNGDDQQLSFTQDPDVNFDEPSAGAQSSEGGDRDHDADDDDDDHRKLFVGGLSRDSETTDLKDYFSKFGEVTKCDLKKDQESGRSRGFCFVVFKDPSSVEKVLQKTDHFLQGKGIDPKKANPRKREPNLKVFVGGLNVETPESDIREHFQTFGKIVDLELPKDLNEKRRRFCFVTFDSEEIVKKVVENRMQTIGGKEVEVKKSVPRQDWRGGYRGGWGGATRGRGRGRGWYQGYDNYHGYGNSYNYGNYNHGYGNYNQGYGNYDNNYYGYNQGYNGGGSGWSGGSYDQGYYNSYS